MRKTKALAIARRSSSSIDELISASCQYVEVDRLLAVRPDATDVLLNQLARGTKWIKDDEVCSAILNHPNVSLFTFTNLATYYPEVALLNKKLLMHVLDDPFLFKESEFLLEHASCPVEWIEHVFKMGSYPLMLRTLQNPNLPDRFRQRLSPQVLQAEAVTLLDKLAAAKSDNLASLYINAYRQLAVPQPYAVPVYLPFDRSDRSHRLADQVLFGFPFTSCAWPWPLDEEGKHMQPIAQIDLDRAGQTLNEPLGDGLLQVWFAAKPTGKSQAVWEPLLRAIPRSALNDTMDDFYPEGAIWNPEINASVFSLREKYVPSARVEWLPLGKMYPRPALVLSEWCENQPITDLLSEEFSSLIENSGLPCMEGKYLDDKSKSIHLGGYVFGYGNEDDLLSWVDQSLRVLFYVSQGFLTIAVVYRRDSSGQAIFHVRITADR